MKQCFIYLPDGFNIEKNTQSLSVINNNNDREFTLLYCNGVVNFCSANFNGNKLRCISCIRLIKKIYKKNNLIGLSRNILTPNQIEKLDKPIVINNIEDIKNQYYESCDSGWAALSTYVSFSRNIGPYNNKQINTIKKFTKSASVLFNVIKNYLETKRDNEFYVFNSRLFDTRPAFRAAKTLNIDTKVIEVGGSGLNNIVIFDNAMPHDINYVTLLINKLWKRESIDNKLEIAKIFFINKKNNTQTNDKIYTKNQIANLLPTNWNNQKRNIAIFNSSEDEFFAIGPEWTRIYSSQVEGIERLCESLLEYNNIQLYLRVHPNLLGLTYKYVTDLYDLEKKYKNITVIKPEEQISSYALIDNCEKVITFGSTIGVEACYWEKVSICLGMSLYSKLGAVYLPQNHTDVMQLITNTNLPKLSKEGALKYGYFIMENSIGYQKTEKIKIKPFIFEKILYKSVDIVLNLFS